MRKCSGSLWLVLCAFVLTTNAQEKGKQNAAGSKTKFIPVMRMPLSEKEWLRAQIDSLTQPRMYGRGYVKGGIDSAAKYLARQFYELKLKPAGDNGKFEQGFAFPVNTFPGKVTLAFNDQDLVPGIDFIIDPASASFSGEGLEMKTINLGKIRDADALKEKLSSLDPQYIYYFENGASFCEKMQIRKDQLAAMLPKGCYIIPGAANLQWSVSRDTMAATVFYLKEGVFSKKIKAISAHVDAVYVPHSDNMNLVGELPGDVRDSLVVLTAHYDNLGMMGETVFPGANCGASGVAMLLSLANYFSAHPQHYSILFIAFAGEEATLMGSEFFVWHPLVPLKNIKFLANLDLVGDATDGISVVNAPEFPSKFALLEKLNEENQYLPNINSKPPAANGDQYHFTQMGVPSFFIYANGGHGYYHEVNDTEDLLTLENANNVAKLLIDFIRQL